VITKQVLNAFAIAGVPFANAADWFLNLFQIVNPVSIANSMFANQQLS
jgi:hypothetical protein